MLFSLIRCARQFSKVEEATKKVIPETVLKRMIALKNPKLIKLLESCLEAPFQLILQLFVIMAGKRPGKNNLERKG